MKTKIYDKLNRSLAIALKKRVEIRENAAEAPNFRFEDSEEMITMIAQWAQENDVNLVVKNLEEIDEMDFEYSDICHIDGMHYTRFKDFSQNKFYNEISKSNTLFLIRNYNDYSNRYREYIYGIVKQHLFLGEKLNTILFTIATTNPEKENLGMEDRANFSKLD